MASVERDRRLSLTGSRTARILVFFFFNYPPPPDFSPFPLPDALPISIITGEAGTSWAFVVFDTLMVAGAAVVGFLSGARLRLAAHRQQDDDEDDGGRAEKRRRQFEDRKSTRLNSSHMSISYAVFCLKK